MHYLVDSFHGVLRELHNVLRGHGLSQSIIKSVKQWKLSIIEIFCHCFVRLSVLSLWPK